MKKETVCRAILLVAWLAAAAPALSQGVKLGVKGGYNVTEMKFSRDVANVENRYGFYVGPTLKAWLPLGLGFDLAALYDQREALMEGETVRQRFVDVPLNLRWNFGLLGIFGFYVAAGPQVSFAVGDKEFSLQALSPLGGQGDVDYRLRDSNFSVNAGAGLYLTKHFEVGFVHNWSIGKTGEIDYSWATARDELTKAHANAWQVQAAIYF